MPASPVFSIIEILEQILRELPPLDIICCQRVNSTWRQVVAESPLLQYLAWLRTDCSNPSYRIESSDFMPQETNWPRDSNNEIRGYIDNVSQHLHPIVVSNIMEHLPEYPGSAFDPLSNMDKDGFGGYFDFRPILHRDLTQWYERNKATEHIWGKFSLLRPEARKVSWSMSNSDDSALPIDLEAVVANSRWHFWNYEVIKEPGQPLSLTLSDLVGILNELWVKWMEHERSIHNWTHVREGCDFDVGIPFNKCLGLKSKWKSASDEEDEDTNDEDEFRGRGGGREDDVRD